MEITLETMLEKMGVLFDEKLADASAKAAAQAIADAKLAQPLPAGKPQEKSLSIPELFAKSAYEPGIDISGHFVTPAMKSAEYRMLCNEFMKAVISKPEDRTAAQVEILRHAKTVMTSGSNTDGGYAIPPGFLNEIIYLSTFYSNIFSIVDVIPMGYTIKIPIGAKGVIVYWPGEGTAITKSSNTLTQPSLTANPQGCAVELNRSLPVFTGPDILGWVIRTMAEAMAIDSEDKIVNGSGSSQPYGFTDASYSSVASVSMAGSTLAYPDLVSAKYTVNRKYRGPGCCWLFNDTAAELLDAMTDGQDRPLLIQSYGNQPAFGDKRPDAPDGMMLGFPFYIVPSISSTYGSSAAYTTRIYFGNFKHSYKAGMTSIARMEQSTEAGTDTFLQDNVILKTLRWWDGKVIDQSGICYIDAVK